MRDEGASQLRAGCEGLMPLTSRVEPWQLELAARSDLLAGAIGDGEAPVHVVTGEPMARNAAEILEPCRERGVDCRLFFARKANKCLHLVDAASDTGLGVDVASDRELRETLAREVAPADVVVTSAVKPRPLLERAIREGATLVLDNADELSALVGVMGAGAGQEVALRLDPEIPGAPPSRFGAPPSELVLLARRIRDQPGLRLAGLHFHLDGYRAADRAFALGVAIGLVDELRGEHPGLRFIDAGGGIPMSYLESEEEWQAFWSAHRAALLGGRPPLTFGGDGLGLRRCGEEIGGSPAVYPYWQRPVRCEWVESVLDARVETGAGPQTTGDALRERGLELRFEPGRSLLDGCGVTVALVHFVKQRGDGKLLVGLGMNRTQCRSGSADFMLDPFLLPRGEDRSVAGSGFLVGAYCIERELITLRELRFPRGVAVGDLIVIPNTAGYQMHFLESSSHRMPPARNLVWEGDRLEPDPIETIAA